MKPGFYRFNFHDGRLAVVCPTCGGTVVRMMLSVTDDTTDGPLWYRCDCGWEGNHPDQVYRTVMGDFRPGRNE